MTLVTNSFEGGSNTTVISAANSGGTSGTAFTAVTGTAQTFSTTQKMHGTVGCFVQAGLNAASYLEWSGIAGSTNAAAVRFYLYIPSGQTIGTSDWPLVQLRSTGNGTELVNLLLGPAGGNMFLKSLGNVSGAATSATALAYNTWYRIEWQVSDASTTTGTSTVRVYVGDSATEQTAMGHTFSNGNFNTSTIGTARFGRPAALGNAVNYYFDDVAFQTGATTLIGVPASNVAPTANAGSDKTATAGVNLAITGADSDTDGTIVSRAWTVVSSVNGAAPTLTNANTATVTFNSAAAGSVHTLRYTVTDDGGLTGSDDVVVYVPSSVVVPISSTSNPGAWTNVGGTANAAASLSDALDTTYVQSPTTASGAALRMRLAPLITPSTFSLTVRHQLSSAGTNTSLVRLYEGSTLRKEWTVVPTTSWADTVLSLTTGEIATVTNWNALDVEFNWTAS